MKNILSIIILFSFVPLFAQETVRLQDVFVEQEKKEYINTLSNSFKSLEATPKKWNDSLNTFFNQELKRIEDNAILVHNSVSQIGKERT